MEKLYLFLFFITSFIFAKAWSPILLEVSTYEFPISAKIIASDTSPSGDLLFVSTQDENSNQTTIFDISSKEDQPISIHQINTDSVVYFILAKGANGVALILMRLDNNGSSIMEIYNTPNNSQPLYKSTTIVGAYVNDIKCVDDSCNIIAVGCRNGLMFFNITFLDDPKQMSAKGDSLPTRDFSQISIIKNKAILAGIETRNISWILDISDFSSIKVLDYEVYQNLANFLQKGIITGMGVVNDNIIWKQFCVRDTYQGVTIFPALHFYTINNTAGVSLDFLANSLSCEGYIDVKTKSLNNEYYYFLPAKVFWQKNADTGENLFFNSLGPIIDLHLPSKHPDFKIFVYAYYFSIYKIFSINPKLFPYSITEIQLGGKIKANYFYTINTTHMIASDNNIYNIKDPRNISQGVTVRIDNPNKYPHCSFPKNEVFASPISSYYLAIGTDGMGQARLKFLCIAIYSTKSEYLDSPSMTAGCLISDLTTLDGKVRTVSFGQTFYFNYNGLCNIFALKVDKVTGSQQIMTNITGSKYSVMASCIKNKNNYLFSLNSTFFMNIYEIEDPENNPGKVQFIASFKIETLTVMHMTVSKDCNFAYLVGINVFIVNIMKFESIFIEKIITFVEVILWVGVSENSDRLYLDGGQFFYIFDILNLTNIYMTSLVKKTATADERNNLIYTINTENFIFLSNGDFFVESSYYYFMIYTLNTPQVGRKVSFKYAVFNLISRQLGNSLIQDMNLLSVSSNHLPLKTPLAKETTEIS